MTPKFRHLPPFAEYILQFRFSEYLDAIKQVSKEVNVPLLKYFEEMPREELDRLTYESGKRFLSAIKNSQFNSFIEEGRTSWLQNQLPIISRDQVVVEDITLVNYCRRWALRNMVTYYTQDLSTVLDLCDEIDWFMMMNDSALFSTYIGIQQNNLEKINQSLVQREQQLLEAQSIAHIGSFEWDLTESGKSTFTAEVYKIFDFDRSNGLENFMLDVHPEDQQKLRQAITQSMISGIYDCEYRYVRNRNLKYIWSRGVVHYANGKPVSITGTIADITEKAVLIDKLKEAEELSKQAQALSNTGNWKWTIADHNIDWSDEMYRIYGLTPQSEKITFERFLSFIHPDDRQRRAKEIVTAIETGIAADYNMRIINPDGTEKVLRGKGEVITDESGKALGMVGTCQDITMEYGLSAELLTRNEELTRKNKELESFNFIASHDLQEPLRKIQLYSSRLTAEHSENLPTSISHHISRITSAAESLQAMIKDFLYFSQYSHDEENCSPIDLNILINRIISGYDMLIAESGMECKLSSLPVVHGRPNQIYQALRSLISNALKFYDPAKKPLLKIDGTVTKTRGRSYFKICFADNGIGFEPQYKERIFEVFQRLHAKDEYPGSGIGLSVAKKIIEDHNGFIEVETEPGKGSVFSIFLPVKNIPDSSFSSPASVINY
jgi:PAS domain S-box-containing protein